MSIKEARKIVTFDILWKYFGFRGKPMPSQCSPLRPDQRPSFGIFEVEDVEYFIDFGTDEWGDTYEFFKLASGITDDQLAYREFFALAKNEGDPKPRLQP